MLKPAKDFLATNHFQARGRDLDLTHRGNAEPATDQAESNPLLDYFRAHKEGPGIWKWHHYFEVYHRHLERFRGRKINVLEIGIYSGGSLGLWRDYFGKDATIHGVDIVEACKVYETEGVEVHIGDQGSREFWEKFRAAVPLIDIVIDDGSHQHPHQIVSLEELLPWVNRGGVYICEDVHGGANRFAAYVHGLASGLNDQTSAQAELDCVAFYPYMTVIEKRRERIDQLTNEMRGTLWQPDEFWQHGNKFTS